MYIFFILSYNESGGQNVREIGGEQSIGKNYSANGQNKIGRETPPLSHAYLLY